MASADRKLGLRKGKGWRRVGSKDLKRAASKGVRAHGKELSKSRNNTEGR